MIIQSELKRLLEIVNMDKLGERPKTETKELFSDRIEVKIEELLLNFLNNWKSEDSQLIISILKKIIGLGHGSTPQGDDYLMGVIFINYLYKKDDFNKLKAYLESINLNSMTTEKSVKLIQKFLIGNFPKIINSFLKAENDKKQIEILRTLQKEGASTGKSFLKGMMMTISHLEITYFEYR